MLGSAVTAEFEVAVSVTILAALRADTGHPPMAAASQWRAAGGDLARLPDFPPDVDVVVGSSGDDTLSGTDGSDEIWADPTVSDSVGGDDTVFARAGDDLVYGFGGDNHLDGGRGDDTLVTADGDDRIYGREGRDDIQSGRGRDIVHGGPLDDLIRGGEGDDQLFGEGGNDRVVGGSNDDRLCGGIGDDQLEGLGGLDTFVWMSATEGRDIILDFALALDRLELQGMLSGFDGSETALVQYLRILPNAGANAGLLQVDDDGASSTSGWSNLAIMPGQQNLAVLAMWRVGDLAIDDLKSTHPFDPLAYIASYGDLIEAFGADAFAGKRHYLAAGFTEQRTETFDGLQYIASYGDLIEAFGPDRDAGATHFIVYGFSEGRPPDEFDEVQYLANYPDLAAAFGTDYEAATQHFIVYGHAEGRTDEPLSDPALVAAVVAQPNAASSADFLI